MKDPRWPASEEALTKARDFLTELKDRRVVVAPHPSVDGLAAGALMLRALQALGAQVMARVPGKGEHAFSPAFQERLRAAPPDAFVVLERGPRPAASQESSAPALESTAGAPGGRWRAGADVGLSSSSALDASGAPPGIPTLIVAPQAESPGNASTKVLSAQGLEPPVSCSVLTFALVSPCVVPGPLEWLAVLGTVADQGADAPIPFLKDALRRAGRTAVTEAVSLLNAARKSSRFAAPLALGVLLRAGSATDITRGNVPGVDTLHDCRLEVQREVLRCSKTPPRIASPVALLLFSSEAQVHPQVAVRWAQRLPEHIIIAANAGYLPGRVDFAVRSRMPMGLGALPVHPTGGSLSREDFLRFAAGLGFKGLRDIDVERRGAFPG
ncbi:hypothetical protein LILAB_25880 [Corallococcus macrosporus]|uniref:DHH family phosphoesterase n=2 Tax=Myxococcaceae TaxID=31 RepID=F8C9G9_MYXFH|nr:hypothetical protein LILAB_25880 [Corallococcus macrosporus]